ncbi:uncharacterized protein [Parasteatoda tepidariorum]|uniref:Protein FAM195A n=1 Tax=Parasteatoda tepidariorum TaxID=114398 RepID=A0A2L2YJC5_PARTP|nr:uncharacterized protein LOC107448624 [Parasteatoda tepidariorum]
MSSRPSFHQVNGRRQYVQRPSPPESSQAEIIKYVQESWKNILREIEYSRSQVAEGKAPSISYYCSNMPEEQSPHPDFKRFDLDGFLERRSLHMQANKQSSQ